MPEFPSFNPEKPDHKNLLPRVSQEIMDSLMEDFDKNPDAGEDFGNRLIEENPELMHAVLEMAHDFSNDEQVQAKMVKYLLLLCILIENQLEADKMNKEFGDK